MYWARSTRAPLTKTRSIKDSVPPKALRREGRFVVAHAGQTTLNGAYVAITL